MIDYIQAIPCSYHRVPKLISRGRHFWPRCPDLSIIEPALPNWLDSTPADATGLWMIVARLQRTIRHRRYSDEDSGVMRAAIDIEPVRGC